VNVRAATKADLPRLEQLWLAFEQEIPPQPYVDIDQEEELRELEEIVRDHVALLAERDSELIGFVLARLKGSRHGFVSDLYVVPEARRGGVAAGLLAAAVARLAEQGAEAVELDVQAQNAVARAVYERWGFREIELTMSAGVDELKQRLAREDRPPSQGRVYAQTDDAAAIERAVKQFVPRLGHSERTDVRSTTGGWVCVDDELCSRDPTLLRRLAQELSYRTGGVVLSLGIEEAAVVRYDLFDRGSLADEYLSVPEYFGPLPPGDVVAMAANPTVVARLTGADPGLVREVARTAGSPSELPPADQLLARLVDVLGLGSLV
jgi:ribosomal protein S18 acetylase RimI-like enzyme